MLLDCLAGRCRGGSLSPREPAMPAMPAPGQAQLRGAHILGAEQAAEGLPRSRADEPDIL